MNLEEIMLPKTHTTPTGYLLQYRVHLPNAQQKVPLIIFLHGAGERGDDNTKQLTYCVADTLKYLQKTNTSAIVCAPQCPEQQRWANVDWQANSHTMPEQPSRSMSAIIDWILTNPYPIDTTRIYITGISMGGFGTWDLIQRHPELFAAAIPICGGADLNHAEKLKSLPLWVFHGDKDEVILPKRSRDIVQAISGIGGNIRYTEYENIGHNSWTITFQNDEVLAWLLAQQKN